MVKLENLMYEDATDDVLAELIDTKIQLNLEINREELYWEQRNRVN